MKQRAIRIREENFGELIAALSALETGKVLLVCDATFFRLTVSETLRSSFPRDFFVLFDGFRPNPDIESVQKGIELYRQSGCGAIFAVGGGSAIDVAKCIKLYLGADLALPLLSQPIRPNGVPFFAMPTTAGTGSEATAFAVVYENGVKHSVGDESCIPSVAVFDPGVLVSLPLYQKKATYLDALCHATESFWSVRATPESMQFSLSALAALLKLRKRYFANDLSCYSDVMDAAHVAGEAINLAKTTAGHAMCYKLTSLYGIAHGHAAAVCVNVLLPYLEAHAEGETRARIDRLGREFGGTPSVCFRAILDELDIDPPPIAEEDLGVLASSVNPERLGNFPLPLDHAQIVQLYRQIGENK